MPTVSPGSFRRSVTGIRKSQRVSKHPAGFESQDSCAEISQDDVVDPCAVTAVLPVLDLSRQDYEHPVIFGEWMTLTKKTASVMDKRPSQSFSRKSSGMSFSPSPTESLLHNDEERFQQELIIAAEANPKITVPRSLRHVAKKIKAVDYSPTAQDEVMEEGEDLREGCVSPDGLSLISEDFSQSPRSAYHTPVNSQPQSLKPVESSPNEFFTQPSTFPAEVRLSTLSASASLSVHGSHDVDDRNTTVKRTITREVVETVFRESLVEDALDIINRESQQNEQALTKDLEKPPSLARSTGQQTVSFSPSTTNPKSRFTTYDIPDAWPFAALLSNEVDGEAVYQFSEKPKVLPVKASEKAEVRDRYQLPPRRIWRPKKKNDQPVEILEEVTHMTAEVGNDIEEIPVNSPTSILHPQRKEQKHEKKKKFRRGHKWKTFRRIKNRLKVGNDESFSFWQMSSWNSHHSKTDVREPSQSIPPHATDLLSEDEPSQSREAVTLDEHGTDESRPERPQPSESTSAQSETVQFQTAQSQFQAEVVSSGFSDKDVIKCSAESEVVPESDSDDLIAEWAELSDTVELANVETVFHTLLEEPFD